MCTRQLDVLNEKFAATLLQAKSLGYCYLSVAHKFSRFTGYFFPTFARPFDDAVVGNCKSSMHSVYKQGKRREKPYL